MNNYVIISIESNTKGKLLTNWYKKTLNLM